MDKIKSNEKLQPKVIWNIFFIIIFTGITFLITFQMFKTGKIIVDNDFAFHSSRAQEIYQNIRSGHFFTFIATHTFHGSGVANFLFYPDVFLYPWAILLLIFKPVAAFYIWYALVVDVTFIIAFYSSKVILKNNVSSFVFACLYTIFPYHFFVSYGVFGEFLALMFVPMFILGGYQILFQDGKGWKSTAIAFSLVLYCHIISAILCLFNVIVLFIVRLVIKRNVTKKIWISILKSLGLAGLMSLVILMPFFTDYFSSKVFATSSGINILFTQNISDFVLNSFTMQNLQGLSVFLIIILFLGFINYKNKLAFVSWILGVLFVILSTRLAPWSLIGLTPLKNIQFPYRFVPYAAIYLSLSFVLFFEKLFYLYTSKKALNICLAVLSISVITVTYYRSFLKMGYLQVVSSKVYELKQINGEITALGVPSTVTDKTYGRIFKYGVTYGEFDYYTKLSHGNYNYTYFNDGLNHSTTRSIVKNYTYVNDKRRSLKITPKNNYFFINARLNKKSEIDLPIIAYKHTYVTVNGKKISYQISDRGTVEITGLKGNNRIIVGYRPSSLYFVGLITSAVSWMVLIIQSIKEIVTRRKNVKMEKV